MKRMVVVVALIVLLLAAFAVFFAWPKESQQRLKVIENGIEWDCTKVDGEIIGCVSSSTTAPRI